MLTKIMIEETELTFLSGQLVESELLVCVLS
jgi:hypothetical protein